VESQEKAKAFVVAASFRLLTVMVHLCHGTVERVAAPNAIVGAMIDAISGCQSLNFSKSNNGPHRPNHTTIRVQSISAAIVASPESGDFMPATLEFLSKRLRQLVERSIDADCSISGKKKR
jgi:hypothetical protein